MFGFSLVRTRKLMAIYDKMATFALDKIQLQNHLSMEIKGKVLQALPMEGGTSKSGNPWQKASLIVEVAENPQYPKKVKISNMQKAEEFAKIAIGVEATFKIGIESREYNGRWYTELTCWGWDAPAAAAPQTPPAPQPAPAQNDDLPF